MQNNKDTSKKVIYNTAVIILLIFCLGITTYAAIQKFVSSDGTFQTGNIKININDGSPIIESNEFVFEPGMTVEEEFFVKNEGTGDVYFKVYFENVEGDLADILNIKLLDGSNVLFDGTPDRFTKKNVSTVEDVLKVSETKTLKILIHYPEKSGNDDQGSDLTFNLCANAVQAKNNERKEFE